METKITHPANVICQQNHELVAVQTEWLLEITMNNLYIKMHKQKVSFEDNSIPNKHAISFAVVY